MNKITETILDRISDWPQEAQEELMQSIVDIEAKHVGIYRLSDDERAAVREGLAQAGVQQFDYDDETILLRYPLRVKNKCELLEKAKANRVELGDWFLSPLHPIELVDHDKFGYTRGQCQMSEQAAEEVINLPLHQWMTLEKAESILNFVLEYAEI